MLPLYLLLHLPGMFCPQGPHGPGFGLWLKSHFSYSLSWPSYSNPDCPRAPSLLDFSAYHWSLTQTTPYLHVLSAVCLLHPTETERCLVHSKCLNFFFFCLNKWMHECDKLGVRKTPAQSHGWRLLRVEAGLELSTRTSSFPGRQWAQWVLTTERAIQQSHKAGSLDQGDCCTLNCEVHGHQGGKQLHVLPHQSGDLNAVRHQSTTYNPA